MPDKLRLALAGVLTVVAVVSAVDDASARAMNVYGLCVTGFLHFWYDCDIPIRIPLLDSFQE
jgi:hypothetical protein